MFASTFLIPLRITVLTLFAILALVLNPVELSLFLCFEVQAIENTYTLDSFSFKHAEHSERVR